MSDIQFDKLSQNKHQQIFLSYYCCAEAWKELKQYAIIFEQDTIESTPLLTVKDLRYKENIQVLFIC